MRIDDPKARQYYLKEATEQQWSVRTLERNINTLYYQRLLSTRNVTPEIVQAKDSQALDIRYFNTAQGPLREPCGDEAPSKSPPVGETF